MTKVFFRVGALLALVLLAVAPQQVIAERTAQASCKTQHLVQTGDNLYRIGLKYGVPWPNIAAANNIANPDLIFVGQLVCIPGVATATPAARTPTATSTSVRTVTPGPTSTLAPTRIILPTSGVLPRFSIVAVAHDKSVTIQTANFPPNTKFEVRMGAMGTLGVGGLSVGTTDSGAGGSFRATYNIPPSLRGSRQIAIRMDGPAGYFAYNWFFNSTAP